MSRAGLALLAVPVVVAALACAGGEGNGGPTPERWVVANIHPADYPTARALVWLAERVATDPALGDRLELDLQLGGVLGNEKEVLEKLHFGGVQAVVTSAAPLAEFSPTLGVVTLPYVFRDGEQMWRTLDGPLGDELLASLAGDGLVGLGWYDAGARSFYNRRRPVRAPADLAGLKIRVQKSEVMSATVAALGASPVALGFKDVYTNLHTGAIDGAENNLPSYVSQRHFEVAPYFSRDGHSRIPDLLVVHPGAWERLDPAEQAALGRLVAASSREQRRLWREHEAAALATAEAAGAEVHEVTDVAAFQRAVAPLYERFAGASGDWGEWVARIRAVD